MSRIDRRRFIAAAAAMGASAAWAGALAAPSAKSWKERRDLYPEGVASGDPQPDSVILWTRRPFDDGRAGAKLTVEVASDEGFAHVVARAPANALKDSDWTSRVLVGGLKPSTVYWYRFTDETGAGSRIGRTLTAPAEDDPRPVRFSFVSCQNCNLGAQNAYRRMIWEDRHAPPERRLGFVFHLGDFFYELVWYPEDRAAYYDRKVRDLVRYEHGEKIDDFHIPTTVGDYRQVYRAYLHDPDLQDARAWFPFVAMWDNHEFSWQGWQGMQVFNGKTIPAQTRKVAAMQAWFEFQPARVFKPSGPSLDRFDPPQVANVEVTAFDEHGLGTEPNNLTAINSLRGYRALRYGKNVDLIITDQHSYRSEEPTGMDQAAVFGSDAFPNFYLEEAAQVLDGGRAYDGGRPPATIRFEGKDVPNFRKDAPPQTVLGTEQRAWFKDRLKASRATWKIWGSTLGTLDWRADPQNLPAGLTTPWPGQGYACFGGGDPSSAYLERGEIYDLVRDAKITGFATVAGDRHSFWAGYAAKALPPKAYEPVGIAFITGSISAPGMVESMEHKFPKDHPLRPLFMADRPGQATPEPAVNLLVHHGVKSCLEYQRTGDIKAARAAANPDNAPHLAFIDMAGHGYAVVTASPEHFESEFVCIQRPVERATTDDGGPIRYRVVHRARMWQPGEKPVLEQTVLEGDPKLSV